MMNVDVEAIKRLLELVREHELAEFELEQEGIKLRVRKQGPAPALSAPTVMLAPGPAAPMMAAAHPAAAPVAAPARTADAGHAAEPESLELAVVTSPIVGTFYRSPDPSSPAFVDVGQVVRKG